MCAFFLSRSKQGRPFEESAADQHAARERAMRAAAQASAARERILRAAAASTNAPAQAGGDGHAAGSAPGAQPAISKPVAGAAQAALEAPSNAAAPSRVETADTATVDIMAKTSVADGPFKAPRVFHDPDFGPIEIHFGCLPSGDVELPSDDERDGDGLGNDDGLGGDDDDDGATRYVTASGAHDSGRGPSSNVALHDRPAEGGGEEKHDGLRGRAVAVSTGVTRSAAGLASISSTTARIGELRMQPAVTHFRMNLSASSSVVQPVSTSTSTPVSRRGLVTTSGRVGVLPPKSGRGGNGGSFGPTTLHGQRVVKHGGGSRSANMCISPAPSQGETSNTLIKAEYKPPSQRSPIPVFPGTAAAPVASDPVDSMVDGVLRVWDAAAAEEKTDGDDDPTDAAAVSSQVFAPVQTVTAEMAQLTALRRDKPEAARKLMTRGALLVDLACGGGSSLDAFCAVVDKCRPGEFLQWHVDKALVGAALGGHTDILRAMVSCVSSFPSRRGAVTSLAPVCLPPFFFFFTPFPGILIFNTPQCARGAPLFGVDGQDKTKAQTLLRQCCLVVPEGVKRTGEVVRYLVQERGVNVDACSAADGFRTLLHEACAQLDYDTVALLVDLGAGVNSVSGDDAVPLGIVLERAAEAERAAAAPPPVGLTRSGAEVQRGSNADGARGAAVSAAPAAWLASVAQAKDAAKRIEALLRRKGARPTWRRGS